MNWNEWTESYGPELADIKVREVEPMADALRMEQAQEVAGQVWTYIISQKKIGYGVFRVSTRDRYEATRPFNGSAPDYAEWCQCDDPVPHTTGLCIQPDTYCICGRTEDEHGFRDADQAR